jgi:lipoic acid synthetase
MRKLTRNLRLHTVCESARCPNRPECFAAGTATFMILGDICTRACTFCAVEGGKPGAPDIEEPQHVAAAIGELGLKYAVITSVTRDDLPDGGAFHFTRTIRALRDYNGDIWIEVLVPDFNGSYVALQTVIDSSPSVLAHNLETVPRLYDEVRPGAGYRRSLELLRRAKALNGGLVTKSGLMLGLGETRQEVTELMADLRNVGCELLTIGQYLQPSMKHYPVARYIPPPEFEEYREIGCEMGFISVTSAPLARSSFRAAEAYLSVSRTEKK